MLDIGWAELLVVGVVALLVVGPKELPGLLRTLGKYLGMVRRQANEFKAQFNDAIKDTEIDELRKEVDAIRNDTAATFRDVQSSVGISDSDIGKSGSDATWMTEDSPPSPAETAAQAAAKRAEDMRKGGSRTQAAVAAPSGAASAAATVEAGAEAGATTKPAANGSSPPHSADAGA